MSLQDYADIRISFDAETVSRDGFGTLLFMTEDDTETPGTMTPVLGSLQEVIDAGYSTDSEPYKFAQSAFAQDSGFSRLKFYHKDPALEWVDEFNNAITVDDDFYALAIETRQQNSIEAVAQAVEARTLLFIPVVPATISFDMALADGDILELSDGSLYAVEDDSGVTDAQVDNDLASRLLDQNLSRTGLMFKIDGAVSYPEASWFGRMLPDNPGTVNWAWKTLAGQVTDRFTRAQRATLRAKRANYYEAVAGNSITFEGVTSEPGTFLDIVRGIDWLQQRMQEDFVAVQTSVGRIPYVGGGGVIESDVIRRRLDIAVGRNVLADDYSVTVPNARDQDPTDRADRHFPGMTFEATYVGAVNSVEIRGVVTP